MRIYKETACKPPEVKLLHKSTEIVPVYRITAGIYSPTDRSR